MDQQAIKKSKDLKDDGNYYYKKRQFAKAIKKYTSSIKLNPNIVESYSNRALAYINLNKYSLALKDCQIALKINARHNKTIARKGKALTLLLRVDQAISFIQREKNIENYYLYDQVVKQGRKIKGVIQEYIGFRNSFDYGKAYSALNSIGEIIKDSIEISFCKLQCLTKTNPPQALVILKSLQPQIDQKSFFYWYIKSLIQLQMGLKIKSKRYLQESIRLHPSTYSKIQSYLPIIKFTKDQLQTLLNNIHKCESLLLTIDQKIDQPLKAKQNIRKINQVLSINAISKSQCIKVIYLRAKCYNVLRQKPKELNDLNTVLRIDPNYYEALECRFQFYQNQYNNQLALQDAQTLSRLNPQYRYQLKKYKKFLKHKNQHKPTYYQIMQLQQSSTPQQIKKSYKQLAMIYHPDKNRGLNNEEQEYATIKFKQLQKAYDCLSSPQKKNNYDFNKVSPEDENRKNFDFEFMNLFKGFPAAGQYFRF